MMVRVVAQVGRGSASRNLLTTVEDGNKMLPALIAAKVAELADALDSGSSSRKAVGVQVPPFALNIITAIVIVSGLVSCGGPEARIIDAQVTHLQGLADILAKHPGDTDKAVAGLQEYVTMNMKSLMDARRDTARYLKGLSEDGRSAFAKKSVERTRELRDRIRTAIATYQERERILHFARQLFL